MSRVVPGRSLQAIDLDAATRAALAADFERFADGLPDGLEAYVLERYRLDLSSEYAGIPVKNPFGKGSGQLSLNVSQVARDAKDGLGFVVLKTIIAEDEAGSQSMHEWAIPETRMAVERIDGAEGGSGWTVTWKGRGWYDTFENYMELFAASLDCGAPAGMLVVPSCKYHLPRPGESEWRSGEYEHTTRRLLDVWESRRSEPMPLEKDFSPTLAGSDRAGQTELILEWLTRVPELVRHAAGSRGVSIGLKLFNAIFDDDFQIAMLRGLAERAGTPSAPDFVVYANRLFDAGREFEGRTGVAYGGPDLSARNLRILDEYRSLERAGDAPPLAYPMSATGDIRSGRVAAEYLALGASTFQMHTIFQLPAAEYRMPSGGKSARALHTLLFDPDDGFIAAVLCLRRKLGWPDEWNVKQMADAARLVLPAERDLSPRDVPAIVVRPLAEPDLEDASRLVALAGWNQTDADWRRLLRLEPDGCFAATSDDRVVGTATTTTYGKRLAWIGMVLVDPSVRRRGIATRLMHAALAALDRKGVATVELDATPAGRPVYEALGFEAESTVERWELPEASESSSRDGLVGIAPAGDADFAELLALDRLAFGADRSELLGAVRCIEGAVSLVARHHDGVAGYAIVRPGARASYVGPVVAVDREIAAALVDAAIGSVAEGALYIDVDTRFDDVRSLLAERGFTKQRDLVRMRRGEALVADAPELVVAIAGPEVG